MKGEFPLTKEEVRRLYIDEQKDLNEIAKIAFCSRQRLARWMSHWGIERRPTIEAATLARQKKGDIRGPHWKGGAWYSKGQDTWYSYAPKHPKARHNGCYPTHILVAEERIGRFLEEGEVVHHLNMDRSDNTPSNLCVLSERKHMLLHRVLGEVGIKLLGKGQTELVLGTILDESLKNLIQEVYLEQKALVRDVDGK